MHVASNEFKTEPLLILHYLILYPPRRFTLTFYFENFCMYTVLSDVYFTDLLIISSIIFFIEGNTLLLLNGRINTGLRI